MHKARVLLASLLILLAATPMAAGETSLLREPDCPDGATVEVSIMTFSFSPASIEIQRGDKVVWTNDAINVHTTTEDYVGWENPFIAPLTKQIDTPEWDSGFLSPGDSVLVPFCEAGVFQYHCEIHRNGGTVVVRDEY